MEKLMEMSGVPGLLASMVAIASLQLIARLGEFLWKFREKRDALTESSIQSLSAAMQRNTAATENLDGRIKNLEGTIGDVSRAKTDIRRLYGILRLVTGDKWDGVRRQAAEAGRATDL